MNTALEQESNSYQGKYLTIDYSFSDEEGRLLGSSQESGPFTFCFGAGDAIPGLETFIVDAPVGEIQNFIIKAADAYGVYKPELERVLPKSSFPEGLVLFVGQKLFINNERVCITDIDDTEVTVNSNHPLAGMDLHFSATITDVSDTPPEAHACGCGNSSCGCS